MGPKLDRWTAAVSAVMVMGALLACKKKEEPPPPVATEAPPPEPPKEEEPKKEEPKKEEVKRYPDKEQTDSGTVRVLINNLRVYDDADENGTLLTTLNRGTLVNRKARMGNWLLIDYPSGVGELSPGWVMATSNYYKVEKDVKPEEVAKQDAAAPAAKQDAAAPAATQDAAPAATQDAAPAATQDASAPVIKIPKLKLPKKGGN